MPSAHNTHDHFPEVPPQAPSSASSAFEALGAAVLKKAAIFNEAQSGEDDLFDSLGNYTPTSPLTNARLKNSSYRRTETSQTTRILVEARICNDEDEEFVGAEIRKSIIETLPDKKNWILDDDVTQIMANKALIDQRVVLTRNVLAISYPGMETMIDQIPLHEITKVHQDNVINTLEIHTKDDGYNAGRAYLFQLPPRAGATDAWGKKTRDLARQCKNRQGGHLIFRAQNVLRFAYDHPATQVFIACVIFGNFATIIVQSQLQPDEDTKLARDLDECDFWFTVFFCAELGINMLGHWFSDFVYDGWNIFDTIIVGLSIAPLINPNFPGVLVFRAARAFRVMRIASHLKSLRRIINALSVSVLPVTNAFFIGFIVLCIFAVLGCETYKDRAPEDFGTFLRAFYSLWLVLAFGTWVTSLSVFDENFNLDFGVLMYLVWLVIIVLWIFLQVVVAVLLDNFMQATQRESIQEEREKIEKVESSNEAANPLTPLLKELSFLFDTTHQLSKGIEKLFLILDYDQTDVLTYAKIKEGLYKFPLNPRIRLSEKNFRSITQKGQLCSPAGDVNRKQFDMIIRRELKLYVQRELTDIMAISTDSMQDSIVLQSLRLLLLEHEPTTVREELKEVRQALKDSATQQRKQQDEMEQRLNRRIAEAVSSMEGRFLHRMETVIRSLVARGAVGGTGEGAEALDALHASDSDLLFGKPERTQATHSAMGSGRHSPTEAWGALGSVHLPSISGDGPAEAWGGGAGRSPQPGGGGLAWGQQLLPEPPDGAGDLSFARGVGGQAQQRFAKFQVQMPAQVNGTNGALAWTAPDTNGALAWTAPDTNGALAWTAPDTNGALAWTAPDAVGRGGDDGNWLSPRIDAPDLPGEPPRLSAEMSGPMYVHAQQHPQAVMSRRRTTQPSEQRWMHELDGSDLAGTATVVHDMDSLVQLREASAVFQRIQNLFKALDKPGP